MTEAAMLEAVRAVTGPSVQPQTYAPNTIGQVADPAAIDAFKSAMAVDGPDRITPIPFADQVSALWRSAQLEEQVHLRRMERLAEFRGEGPMSPQELLAMQYELQTMTFNMEVTTTVAKKSSDAVSTLIKNG